MLQKDKPVRITLVKSGADLGFKALLEKHLDKLPRTLAYLESVTETVKDFQIRIIEEAIALIRASGRGGKGMEIFTFG